MKHLLTLLLGLGTLGAVSCQNTNTADVHATESTTLVISGMT